MYLGISLELLRVVWGQFSFRQFLVPAYTSSQGLYAPFNVVNANYRVLFCCTCHFQSSSIFFVYFGFHCLQISSVCNFCPDTRGQRCSFIQAHLFNCAVGREEHCKQISLACMGVLGVSGLHWVFPSFTVCVLSHSTLLRLQVALQGNSLKWALGCMHFPGLSHSGTGSCVPHRGLRFVPFPGLSSSGDQVLGEHTVLAGWCVLSLPWSQALSFLGAR